MKARVLSYREIDEKFSQVLMELNKNPSHADTVIELGGQLKLLLGVCISQMKAPDSASYPDRLEHLAVLEKADSAITYKINTCTVEQISNQVTAAYREFGEQ